jgi:hypothetical protein
MYVTGQFVARAGEYEGIVIWNVTPCAIIK